MAKTIVFCADGTWNGPPEQTGVDAVDGADDRGEVKGAEVTNVVKLFGNLAGRPTVETQMLRNEQEKVAKDGAGAVTQVAKYLHGVGDSSNPVDKVLGGVLGSGVICRVVRGFTFVSRHYERGDQLHLVGFSRGAYTARALGGMIASVGLLNRATYDPNDKSESYRLGVAAWCKSRGVMLNGVGRLTELANHTLGFVGGFLGKQLPKNGLIADVPIKSVAVWDTVGSLGIPVYAGNDRYDVYRLTDTALSPKVERGFHAMAIDELRGDFPVTRWNDRQGISQVWFVGAHSDVGGGYSPAESGLSDVALEWLMRQLAGSGVRFATPLTHVPDRRPGRPFHKPWAEFPFSHLVRTPRRVQVGDVIHESVFERWQADSTYRPAAMAAFAEKGLGALRRDE